VLPRVEKRIAVFAGDVAATFDFHVRAPIEEMLVPQVVADQLTRCETCNASCIRVVEGAAIVLVISLREDFTLLTRESVRMVGEDRAVIQAGASKVSALA
jgi:hypothetical protein